MAGTTCHVSPLSNLTAAHTHWLMPLSMAGNIDASHAMQAMLCIDFLQANPSTCNGADVLAQCESLQKAINSLSGTCPANGENARVCSALNAMIENWRRMFFPMSNTQHKDGKCRSIAFYIENTPTIVVYLNPLQYDYLTAMSY
jgi:hypothetical protein